MITSRALKAEVPKRGKTCLGLPEGTENSMNYFIESSQFLEGKTNRPLLKYIYRALSSHRNAQAVK